ncbi:MAG: type II secretion system F family protein [Planctomycetota bacterium]|nr:type II secretion system F family protein [Planctomycetota bacterium]
MPVFNYTAMDAKGAQASGAMPAQSRADALAELRGKGLIPVAVAEQKAPAAAAPVAAPRRPGGRVSPLAAEAFTRELSHLLAGGVSLSRALHVLSREASQPAAKRQWQAIHDDVVGGMPLGEAMGKWPRSFPPVQVAMVRAGETGGFLDVVLAQIAEFRSRERDPKGKVKSALAYPIILSILAVGARGSRRSSRRSRPRCPG